MTYEPTDNERFEPSEVAIRPLGEVDNGTLTIAQLVRKTPFVMGYVVAALWTDEERLPEGSGIENIAEASLRKAYSDCEAFVANNIDAFVAAYAIYPLRGGDGGPVAESAGHDFWLSRNGQGAGYFDRGLGAAGETLQQAARDACACDLNVGDDHALYFEGGDVVKVNAHQVKAADEVERTGLFAVIAQALPAKSDVKIIETLSFDAGYRAALESMTLAMMSAKLPEDVQQNIVQTALDAHANNADFEADDGAMPGR